MPTLPHQAPPLVYVLKRTRRRRSMALRVDPTGTVTVLVPRFAVGYFIERFVRKREDWIREKINYFAEIRKKHPAKQFVNGEGFSVWGIECSLKIVNDPSLEHPICERMGNWLQVSIQPSENPSATQEVKRALQSWYMKETQNKLAELLPQKAYQIGVTPGKVKVVEQRKRWGSCSRKNDLRFNWRLSMMPPAILEYVLVHELAHIKAHDHSKRFWDLVQSTLPNFKRQRRWLRDNGNHLAL